MQKLQSFVRGTEIAGRSVTAFVTCTNSSNIKPLLEQRHLSHVDPERWYALQDYLNVMSDIMQNSSLDAMFDLVAIGAKIVETSYLPPNVTDLEEFLGRLNTVYQMSHRNGDAGEVYVTKMGEQYYNVTFRTPYPDDFHYGALYGVTRRFRPLTGPATVIRQHSENPLDSVFTIEW